MSQIGLWTQEQGSLLAQVIPVVALALGLEAREATRQVREYFGMLEDKFARLHAATAITATLGSSADVRAAKADAESGSARRRLLTSRAEDHQEYLRALEDSLNENRYALAELKTARIWDDYVGDYLDELESLTKMREYPGNAMWVGGACSLALLVLSFFEATALRSALGGAFFGGNSGVRTLGLALGLGEGLCIAFLMPAWTFVSMLIRKPQLTVPGEASKGGYIARHAAGLELAVFVVICATIGSFL